MKHILLVADSVSDVMSLRPLSDQLTGLAVVSVADWPLKADDLHHALDQRRAAGAKTIVVFPMMLLPSSDRLKELAGYAASWAHKEDTEGTTRVTVAPGIGNDPRLTEMVQSRLEKAFGELDGSRRPILTVDGRAFTFEDLQRLSGQIADVGELTSGREGQGVWFKDVLSSVRDGEADDRVTFFAEADGFSASVPVSEVSPNGFLVYAIDGVPLPARLGGPTRLLIPGYDDRCANVKGVNKIEITGATDA